MMVISDFDIKPPIKRRMENKLKAAAIQKVS
jgi:hypothetical protein